MKQTDQSLIEQMRITEFEIEHRKTLFDFSPADVDALLSCRTVIGKKIDAVVTEFYRLQTSVTEIALLIGDSDTLGRLRNAQRRYVLDLFSGHYDMEYVNNRLRIGLVHKRIGVEPKLYLSAIHTLKGLLHDTIGEEISDKLESNAVISALDKLLSFDVSLVFDTYIRSLVAEIETAKDKSERYARSMEEKVRERTHQLEEMTRIDALTGLLNVRHLEEMVTKTLRSAKRRGEPVAAVYLDVDNFKTINDSLGHQRGDEVLRMIGSTLKNITRIEDSCFRYGGDEFCVILANCREDQAQTIFVDRLNDKLRQGANPVSLSSGIAQTGPNEYVDAHELIRAADKKMYSAKKAFKASLDVPAD